MGEVELDEVVTLAQDDELGARRGGGRGAIREAQLAGRERRRAGGVEAPEGERAEQREERGAGGDLLAATAPNGAVDLGEQRVGASRIEGRLEGARGVLDMCEPVMIHG